jgi:hypothetical protein
MGGNFAILNPCPKRWSDLSGDGRVRYCDLCKKNVHALDEYSPAERGALWRESDGHVCGMLSTSPPEPLRSRRVILLGALLTAVSPLFAQSGRLRIRVTDATGAVVPNANISIKGTSITASTDVSGEAIITDLPVGNSQISITVPGFRIFDSTVTIQARGEQKLQATLQIGELVGEVVRINPEDLSEQGNPAVNTIQMPYSQTLDLPQSTSPSTPSNPTKRHWWQIFR